MMKVLLLQLPIPQLGYGRQTGNIPLGAAYLKQAAQALPGIQVEILPESRVSYLGDAAILDIISGYAPDVLGFTVFSWNAERSLYIAKAVKKHRDVKTIFGGPEVTPDNPLMDSDAVDFRVYGEGEAVFLNLLQHPDLWAKGSAAMSAETIFRTAPSPYLSGLLDPEIGNMMFLETQRGCPYRCGYCYYNKSRRRVCAVPDEIVLKGIQWAYDQGLAEVFMLDPSLNARPRLRELLEQIARINKNRRLAFLSEIRAEAIDRPLADLLAKAGFTEFEIGLQSTNPRALKEMNRPTDLNRFIKGVNNLQAVGIQPKIDLIIGLPGDTPEGFRASVDFVARHGMHDNMQVFFLSVLPGTDFRRRSTELGLTHQAKPPYTVLKTPTFGPNEMQAAFFYAEDVLDVSLQPEPDLDLSYRTASGTIAIPAWGMADYPEGRPYISKVVLNREIPLSELEAMARRLSHPYQIFFMPPLENREFMCKALTILTAANPHTPLEIIFMEPGSLPDIMPLEAALKLHRPLYLDRDLPLLGSASVLFTLISSDSRPCFTGTMKRQVFRWRSDCLPRLEELEELADPDGILMDNTRPAEVWQRWQDDFAARADDLPLISFADVALQHRWIRLTAASDYRITSGFYEC